MEEVYDIDMVLDVIEITKEIRNVLIPFAILFFVIGVLKDLYDHFLGDQKLEVDEDSIASLVSRLFRKNVLALVLFFAFPIIALFPITVMNELVSSFNEVDPVEQMINSKLSTIEKDLRKKRYLNGDNIEAWENTSNGNKLSFLRQVKVREQLLAEQQETEGLDEFLSGSINILKKDTESENKSTGIFTLSDLFSTGDYSSKLTLVFVIVAELVRKAFEYLVARLFTFLLYLDYLLGIFAAFMALLPWTRGNLLTWFIENFSLLAWALIFILVDWLLTLISFTTISSNSVEIQDIAMPLLTIVVYTGVAAYAAKIVGRENGGTPLSMAARSAMTAVPVLGGAAIGTISRASSGLASSPIGQAIGKQMGMMGEVAMRGGAGSVQRSIADTVAKFKPQPKMSEQEKLTSSVNSLVSKLS
jgi:hypothetical protein